MGNLSKDIDNILRNYKAPPYGRTFVGLESVKKQLIRYIQANYEPKKVEGQDNG